MKFTWEKLENSKGILKAVVDGEDWKKAQEKAFNKVASKVKVKGFREGQAPKEMIKKMVGDQEVFYGAIDDIANKVLVEGIENQKLNLVDRPNLDIESMTKDEAVLKFECTVSPDVKLGKYTEVEYEMEKVKVTADEIKQRLEQIQKQYTEQKVKDGEIVDGDVAVIDFEGFKDGVAFEGGKGEAYPLEIGSGSFIPGFEEQLIGLKAGEEKDLDVTFPENYGAKDLAGQPVTFKVKVIEVKENIVPALDDELAKDLDREGIETLKDLEKDIKKEIMDSKQEQADGKAKDDLLKLVVDASEVDIPNVMIENEKDYMVQDMKARITSQGIPFDQYLKMMGQTEAQFRDQVGVNAESRVKSRLILEKIVEVENIKVAKEELDKEYQEIAESSGMEVDQVKQYISEANLEYDLNMRKALDFIKEKAVIKEAKSKKDDAE